MSKVFHTVRTPEARFSVQHAKIFHSSNLCNQFSKNQINNRISRVCSCQICVEAFALRNCISGNGEEIKTFREYTLANGVGRILRSMVGWVPDVLFERVP